MKNQHTPGQWLAHIDINPNDSGLNDIRILEPSTETENLTANTIAVLNQNMGREAIANARLISAAPDLLSSLVALEKASREALDTSATHEGLKNCKILVEARIAIEKAGGEWK